MHVRLLGPVGIETAQARLVVGGPRAQAVVAVLAVRAGEVVTADWLIDQIWGAQPPRSARGSLQAYVSRLRAAGGSSTKVLLPPHPRGYRLDPATARIDAGDFERHAAAALVAARAGRWWEALRAAQDAQRLWRGEPFTGIDAPLLAVERHRLDEIRRNNRLTELRADLELAGAAQVIGALRSLTTDDPWDERPWQLLVLALYRGSRQTEALQTARRARRMLAEEHGLDPTPALVRLEQRILAHDPALWGAAGAPGRELAG
ncbi:AfsR/SARP family transcriptional regulator [Cryptosporangium minutisporangium]|uniref:OmpR/PhoB-type domain-containing protein n=1 Tax=Cryptosporangium minutisporangium TaxID=113569 RepID=A0ABP6ST45_9ACTN